MSILNYGCQQSLRSKGLGQLIRGEVGRGTFNYFYDKSRYEDLQLGEGFRLELNYDAKAFRRNGIQRKLWFFE